MSILHVCYVIYTQEQTHGGTTLITPHFRNEKNKTFVEDPQLRMAEARLKS
jgi:hypothetical protein